MKPTVKKSDLLKSHLNWVKKMGLSPSKELNIISKAIEDIKKYISLLFQ